MWKTITTLFSSIRDSQSEENQNVKMFGSNDEYHPDRLVKTRIYISVKIILLIPLCVAIAYLWSQTPIFQNFWLSLALLVLTLFFASSSFITTVHGSVNNDSDIEAASDIIGLISSIAIIPAAIFTYGSYISG